jgi:hypothetical protein
MGGLFRKTDSIRRKVSEKLANHNYSQWCQNEAGFRSYEPLQSICRKKSAEVEIQL